MSAEQALTLATPALVGAIVGVLVNPLIEAWKARLSRETWARQERWKLKVSLYQDLIVALDRTEGLFEPDFSSGSPRYSELTEAQSHHASEAWAQIRKAKSLASLWLPADVTAAIAKTLPEWNAVYYGEDEDFEASIYESTVEAKKLLLAAVEKDLKL